MRLIRRATFLPAPILHAYHFVLRIFRIAELTTQEAASLLNVSRPYLIKLIEEKKLPCRKVSTHRCIAVKELLDYKRRSNAARRQALKDLADDARDYRRGLRGMDMASSLAASTPARNAAPTRPHGSTFDWPS